MENKIANTLLANELKTLIEQSKQQIAVTVNASLSLLYWQIGKRINEEILKDQRAEYGKQIIASLSNQLSESYGSGWSKRQLHHCIRFAEVFNDYQNVHTLCTQLSWSHLRLIIPLEDNLKRLFYITSQQRLSPYFTATSRPLPDVASVFSMFYPHYPPTIRRVKQSVSTDG